MYVLLILAIVTIPLFGWIRSENARAIREIEKTRVLTRTDPNPSRAVVCVRPVEIKRPGPKTRPFRPTSPKETRGTE